MKKWLLALLVSVGIYAALSGEFFIEGKGSMLASVREGFSGESETDYLREKVQELEIEVLNLKKGNPSSVVSFEGVDAKVYSAYPFADRSELMINAGSDRGLIVGQAVVKGNVLIGRIKEVKKRTSVVQTVFDPEFQIPVRIGEKEVDALYGGGMNPRLNLIDVAEPLPSGEMVISAADGIPYGLGMGHTTQVKEGLLKEASIEPLFEVKDIRNVTVVVH